MNDSEMRILFAAFAMMTKRWNGREDDEEARECFAVADAMVKASKESKASEDTLGIAAIKSRKRVAK